VNEDRNYRALKDLVSGQTLLVYTVNGKADTLHISVSACRDDAEATKILAALTSAKPSSEATGPQRVPFDTDVLERSGGAA
jgi:hypothetical protein